MTVFELMRLTPVIPVVVIDDAEHAIPLARALVQGGIRVLEITMRTAAAMPSVRFIRQEVPEIIVGVGTVKNAGQLELALQTGAQFIVSPGFTTELANVVATADIPWLPGVMTPSEVMTAIECGHRQLKFFPAQQAGGVEMLKALHGPFADVTFCPTGGVSPDIAHEYLALPNVACVGGSWLTPKMLIEKADWRAITQLAKDAVAMR